jgi:hypothetical protein
MLKTKQMRCRDHLEYLSVDSMIPFKWIITEIVSEHVGWIQLAQDRVSGLTVMELQGL